MPVRDTRRVSCVMPLHLFVSNFELQPHCKITIKYCPVLSTLKVPSVWITNTLGPTQLPNKLLQLTETRICGMSGSLLHDVHKEGDSLSRWMRYGQDMIYCSCLLNLKSLVNGNPSNHATCTPQTSGMYRMILTLSLHDPSFMLTPRPAPGIDGCRRCRRLRQVQTPRPC